MFEDAQYLRWAIAGDAADQARTNETLKGMLESFPEVKTREQGLVDFGL